MRWVGAEACAFITNTRFMALVECGTYDRVAWIAGAADAYIVYGACVSVVAGLTQIFRWIGADACLW